MFRITNKAIDQNQLNMELKNTRAGAFVSFEGWVRDHNQGLKVESLEYQMYQELAHKEGMKILAEATDKFNILKILCTHRYGHLALGDLAIWIGAVASHRDEAFKATRYVIDEIKHRLPIWKKEHYQNGKSSWVMCRDHHHHVHFKEEDFYKKQNALIEQNKLKEAKVLVVGAGGLGSPILTSLTQAGIGNLTILDFDQIDISNLHRQSLYSVKDVGEKKALIAKGKLQDINPFINIKSEVGSFQLQHLNDMDLIIDCTDNIETKYLIHDSCFQRGIPLISGSIFKYDATLRTFVPRGEYGCWHCHDTQLPDQSRMGNCNDFGVLGATTNFIGSLMAEEAIQLLQNKSNNTLKHTLLINVKDLNFLKIKNNKNESCLVCQGFGEIQRCDFEVEFNRDDKNFEIMDIRNLSDSEVLALKKETFKIALCCHKGVRSKKLAGLLRSQGHENIYSLKGGACSL